MQSYLDLHINYKVRDNFWLRKMQAQFRNHKVRNSDRGILYPEKK